MDQKTTLRLSQVAGIAFLTLLSELVRPATILPEPGTAQLARVCVVAEEISAYSAGPLLDDYSR